MKILFVVTAFYPEQAIGSIRITKFAKYLIKEGDEVTIISLSPAPWAARDESLYFPALDKLRWISIDQSPAFQRLFLRARVAVIGNQSAVGGMESGRTNPGIKARLKRTAQFAYTLLKAFDWTLQVGRYVRRSLRGEKFDFIFTSYPSLASPFSGLLLQRMGISRSVVIDFRDPLSYGKSSKLGLRRLLESFFLRKAGIATFASEGVREMVSGKREISEDLRSGQIVVKNGFDLDDLSSIQPVGLHSEEATRLRIVYTGSLYGGKRDIAPFFHAISKVLSRSKFSAESIELHYAGDEGALFRELAEQNGLLNSVIDHGRVTRRESLGLQKESDICLLATWNTHDDQGILTGKVFEFFMLRKPVLAIVSGNLGGSEIKKVIESVGAGFCFEQAHPETFSAMVYWLETAMTEKAHYGDVKNYYNDGLSSYSFETAVRSLRGVLKSGLVSSRDSVS